ncbi:uncharacterized protein YMR317W-like [Ixodes scapularis]|uniref:uncharacterized protein YMR317W-like n=1 Tax=Ixodes scapularis TaxID=6945 RepID=UPI001A9D6357|nr:uncharacterized protein YMR317W-like [Ixodes scapularis]
MRSSLLSELYECSLAGTLRHRFLGTDCLAQRYSSSWVLSVRFLHHLSPAVDADLVLCLVYVVRMPITTFLERREGMALLAFATSFVIFLVLGLVLVNLHLKQDVAQPPASNADGEANETSVASEANLTDSVTEDVTEPAWMWIEKRKMVLPVQLYRKVPIVSREYTARSSTPPPSPRTAVARTPRIASSTRRTRSAVAGKMELPKAKNDQPPEVRTGPQTRSQTRVASLAATGSATVRTAPTLDDADTRESPSIGNDPPEARTAPWTTNPSWAAGLAARGGATARMSSIVDGPPTVDIPTERTTGSRFNESSRGWALANTSGGAPSPTSGSGSTSPIWSTSSASSSSFGRWLAEEQEADPKEAATEEAMTSKATYEDAVLTDAAWADPALADAGLTGAVWTAALLTDAAASTSASASMGPSTSTDAASTNATSTNTTTPTRTGLVDEGLANAGTDMISREATLADAGFTGLPPAGDDLREPVHRGTVSTYVVVQTTTGTANSTDMPII